MKANFLVRWLNGQPDLPPMEELAYDDHGERRGGFTCVSAPDKTVIVQVEASDATIKGMKLDAKYLLVDDLLNIEKTINLLGQTAIKMWLENNGYTATVVNKLKSATIAEAIKSIYALHKLTELQYKSGGLG